MRGVARRRARLWLRVLLASASLIVLLLALAAGLYAGLGASLPQLEGIIVASGLSTPVSVERDTQGVPTLTGRNRQDLAWALGYLHAQERYFQMDGLRRTAAGELSDLVGSVALQVDRRARPHRFRSRATAIAAAMDPAERQLLDRYAEGVNRGLTALKAPPFEYLVLRSTPQPWTTEDTLLAVFAMYLNLQEAEGLTERRRANAREVLGTPLAEFLFPEGTSWDARCLSIGCRQLQFPRSDERRARLLSREATPSRSVAP